MNSKIDFVVIWVDGNDPEWLREREKYKGNVVSASDNSVIRYRDWDNMRYWFRGVEKFAPWVNNVFFVTWGHLPKWLNTSAPKLKVIKHSDYIPKEYLPTFSANPIELNLHRIEGLSENFVFFNDDMFVVAPTKESDFFVNNLPCDSAIMNIHCYESKYMYILTPFIDIGVINQYFSKNVTIRNNISKWFNIKYGVNNLRNLYLMPCPRFPGMLQQHLPTSFNKKTFEILWEKEYELLDETCKHKFRHKLDANQWLLKEWQLMSGNFKPRSLKIGKSIAAFDISKACTFIRKQQGKLLCLNDVEMTDVEFLKAKEMIINSFEKILPEKSVYEL